MYINFKVLMKEGLSPFLFMVLVALKQKEFDYLRELYWLEEQKHLLSEGYITTIKVSKKLEGSSESFRLTPKGRKVLEAIETPEVEEEDVVIFDWLKKHYEKLGKEIGNGAKTKRHIRDFRIKSGICKNNMLRLCLAFLQDEENMDYNHKMEFMFYKSPNAFAVRFDLEESRLYKYYLKKKSYFDAMFEEY